MRNGLLVAVLAFCASTCAAEERLQLAFDFESGDLQGWTVVEGRFEQVVCDKKMYRNNPSVPYNKQGTYYLTSLEKANGHGDGSLTGVIESPVFVLQKAEMSLLVGGGSHFNTYVALCTLDGKEILKAHGRDTEIFRRVQWDATELIGRPVFFRVVDGHPAHWGYLAVDDIRVNGVIDLDSTAVRLATREKILDDLLASPQLGQPKPVDVLPKPNAKNLRAAIRDLIDTFGDDYGEGPEFLARLDDADDLAALQREALMANPLLGDTPILFVTRPQYINNHGTEATMCQTGEINTGYFRGGGQMKVFSPAADEVTTLLDLPDGVVRDPDVHFDAKKVVFSMRRNIDDDYHLYEMNVDGGDLRQLTFGSRLSDIQPVYLPDGKIAFSSTREPKYIPCQRHLMTNLFVMEGDGSNVRQIGHNTQFEGRAALMPDGRLLYTRWEYVDKHYASAYGLWTVNPDGTNHALYWGGYAWQPGPVVDAQIVPGTERFVAVFSAVHELAWGAMAVVDRRRGLDGMEPIVRSWPDDLSPWMGHWNTTARVGAQFDSFRAVPVKYEDPWPLSEEYFLCSRSTGAMPKPEPMGIYLVDTFGNEVLLHCEHPGCFDPMPLEPRERPPVIPSRLDLTDDEGTFFVEDVYQGPLMDDVPRGQAKFLRVVEAPPKRTFPPHNIGDWTPALDADGHHPVATNWDHYNNKRILGTVPIESDGSAHFRVPVGRFVYFQLLDADGMMIHSMRSGTSLQPGETAGCVGCHDRRLSSVPTPDRETPLALRRPARSLTPWYGRPRNFSFTAEVQPVLDEHCVGCHDGADCEGKLDLSGDLGVAFNAAYASLKGRSPPIWSPPVAGETKPLVSAIGSGPIKVVGPYTWGSRRSRLIELLREGHEDVELDAESFDRLVTWIDLNTPYYPSHATRYRDNMFGRCPLPHAQLARLAELTGTLPHGPGGAGQMSRLVMTVGSPLNFTRPERSRCLDAFSDLNDPAYSEALSIIRSGQEMLAAHPRLDMPGFEPCEGDRLRIEFHEERRRIEAANRAAIARGETVWQIEGELQD